MRHRPYLGAWIAPWVGCRLALLAVNLPKSDFPMDDTQPLHISVLRAEVERWLAPQPGQVIVDGTLGGGGHTRQLAEAVGASGRVIAIDRDAAAVAAARRNLAGLPIDFCRANYCDLPEVLAELEVSSVDGVLLDLGLSSDQLADSERGFSFDADGPLDLRYNPLEGEPAWRLVERLSQRHLADLIYEFGEEKYSRRIARRIVESRRAVPIRTSKQLAELVRACIPKTRQQRIDPATRTFQALRIAVNDELKALDIALKRMPDCLCRGGRLAIISFHSLEDRRVKQTFQNDSRLNPLTKKPVRPGPEEIEQNPRSRSAKLRVAERT